MKLKYNPNAENSLEIIWNKLSSLYSSKADKFIEDQKERSQMLSYIHTALNELQVVVENNNLINNKIIKKIQIEKPHSFKNNKIIKIENISKILSNTNSLINKFMKKENKTFNQLKNNFIIINNKIINLFINNSRINISFTGEILNYKPKEKSKTKEIKEINFKNLIEKETKKLKSQESLIILLEDFYNKNTFNFYRSYQISVQFKSINLVNTYSFGDTFSEIVYYSDFVSKNEGSFLYKGIKLEISGLNHNFTNINEIEKNEKKKEIKNEFIDFINNALINGCNISDLFEKIKIYLSFYILKNEFKCTEIIKEDDCIYGINNYDIYRINDQLESFKNELKIEII